MAWSSGCHCSYGRLIDVWQALMGWWMEAEVADVGRTPESLLASEHDAGVLGDGCRHVPDEANVGLHVRAAQPEAAHAPRLQICVLFVK